MTVSADMSNMATYDNSVFINCPFDRKYRALFQAMIFTIKACGFFPRCALEFEGDPNRLNKIVDVIRDCQFGVHDVSMRDGRLNMPLELGLFIGCQTYGASKHRRKSYLILEGDPYSSKVYLSDLAGQDPMAHEGKCIKVIECVRNWLMSNTRDRRSIASPHYIHLRYKEFKNILPVLCKAYRWNERNLLFPEFLALAIAWLETNL